MSKETVDTHQKALQINLDVGKYGTVAEIGAGQEVARWFFRVGAAAGTVAKTISAYDMGVSDAIYGKSSRYVSRDRLNAMFDHEWELLLERLQESRGAETSFFAFADTISARNFHGTNISHGWMGVRFQSEPGGEANTLCVHLNMHDETNVLQQQAVGVLGVNLIHAALYYQGSLERLSETLLDDLSLDRVDVDYVSATGPLFADIGEREAQLHLLRSGVTQAVGFSSEGKPQEPMSLFYKAPIIIARGTFHTVQPIHEDLMNAASGCFLKEGFKTKRAAVELFELTTSPSNEEAIIDVSEVLTRVEGLLKMKRPVLVTSYGEGYHLTQFLRRYTTEPIRFTMGISQLMQVFGEEYYTHLAGGIVEGLSRLVSTGVSLYVYPMEVENLRTHLIKAKVDIHDWQLPESGSATLSNVYPIGSVRHLYRYSFETGALLPLKGC